MNYKKIIYSFLSLWLVTGFTLLSAQEPILAPKTNTTAAEDTLITVEILEAKKLEMRKVNDSTQLQILAGKVKLKQGTSYFWCDSCVINSNTNTFEAWGNVHINDADTTNVYANHLLYLTKKKLAYLDGAVKLTDGKGTLTTPDLEYDMETKIGIYKHGGKVVNGNTTLTSREGYYYTDLKDVYFKQNVELKDPKYFLKTDSLLYNTDNGIARFIAETFIKDSAGKTIETKDGYYNLKTGKAEFGRNPVIKDGAVTITGNRVAIDDSTGIRQVEGNAIVRDSAQGTTILAGVIYQNSKTDAILATKKPLMIIKQENDSIYITADTLFSARLSDLYGVKDSLVKDTVKGVTVVNADKAKDSTNRYFEAYRNVRVFSDSLQAVCDSLFYSFKDSVFRMYDNPVVWAKESQVTGDTLYLFTKNKKAERFQVIDHSFLVNKMDPEVYNQIKSSRMDGWFIDGNIDSVRARGYAECIYYIQDEDSAYTGINESKCDIMDIYFKNQELHKVVFRSQVTGTLWPIRQKSPSEMRLENFQWLEARRPKTKFELFE
ncbi:MAG: LPS export ABC transporter periplasmic protein LptC [Chitinophagales bacterium]|nr:LPS export ABC transporter periplasmic protein LptC [Chitinophagales bacterium]